MRQHDDKSRQCVPHSTHASLGTIWSANFVLCWLFPVFEGGVQKEKSLQVYELEGFGFGLTYFVCSFGGEDGIRTRGTGYPVRQFSKLVVSATHPPLRALLTDCGSISLQPGYKAKLFLDKSKKMKLKYETRTNLFVVVNSLNNICKDVGNRKNCKFRQIFVLLQRNGVRNDHLLQCTLVDAVVCRA